MPIIYQPKMKPPPCSHPDMPEAVEWRTRFYCDYCHKVYMMTWIGEWHRWPMNIYRAFGLFALIVLTFPFVVTYWL